MYMIFSDIQKNIEQVYDDYIISLKSEDDIYNITVFRGLLKSIYTKVFKANKTQLHNSKSIIDNSDIQLLSDLWDFYSMLCYKYNHSISMERFSMMTGISQQTFWNWGNEQTRVNSGHFELSKKWLNECEGSLADRAIEHNSIGSMFALKVLYKWQEQPQQIEVKAESITDPQQIAEKYRSAAEKALPEFKSGELLENSSE